MIVRRLLITFSAVISLLSFNALAQPAIAHAETALCPPPVVEATPLIGGQMQLKIQSPCRKGELVFGRYGNLLAVERLDGTGNVAILLDCFMGDLKVNLSFKDDWRSANYSCAAVDNTLTKVAIVWRDRVDLDLHAFEYSASPGSAYDRAAFNPGSYQIAQSESSRSGRSHGFMSVVSDGQRLGHNVEVYTLLHHVREPHGVIAMGVGLGAQSQSAADRPACDDGNRARQNVEFDVYIFERASKLRSYERELAMQPCNGTPNRTITNLIPSIRLGTRPEGENGD